MTGFSIHALHHVQLAMPVGAEDVARAFYVGRLGLTEVAKPDALAGRRGCWFERGALALHLGVEADFRPARKAHPALVVDDLEAARAALDGGPIEALPGLRRFYVADPFGNRIEIVGDMTDA